MANPSLKKFYKQLTPEQLSSIRVVTCDGAKMDLECVNEYTPDCAHCADSHVVEEIGLRQLDEKVIWHDAYSEYKAGQKKIIHVAWGRP